MKRCTLFVCKSCHRSSEELAENQPRDGKILLDILNTLSLQQFAAGDLEIKPVGCLWACSRGCVVSLANPEQRTYLLVDLLPDKEYASALLQLTQMYMNHPKGAFMWDKMPTQLESTMFACIPSALTFSPEEEEDEV